MGSLTPQDIASWPTPNYIDPVTRVNLILGVEIPLTVVMTLFMGARLVARRNLNALGLDDWTMFLAWAIGTAISIVNCISTQYGTGYHIWDCKIAWIPTSGKLALTTQLLFAPCVGITKVSICLTYLRIFPSKTNRWFCYGAMVWLTAWTIGTFFAFAFQCWPVSANWNILLVEKPCINQRIFFIITAALNSLTDILVFLWPARYLWNIQLPRKQRAGLVVSFGIGCLVCVAGACRIWYLEIYFDSYDISWEGAVIYVITAIETNLGIVCGSLPGVKPILARFFPRVFGSTEGQSHPSSDRSKSYGKSFPFQSLPDDVQKGTGAITVRQDIELTRYAADAESTATGSRSAKTVGGRSGSEEWIFDPRTQELRSPNSDFASRAV